MSSNYSRLASSIVKTSILFLVFFISILSCSKDNKIDISLIRIDFNLKKMNMEPLTTQKVVAQFYPENASNKDIIWKSSNPLVASINQLGEITAVSEGTTNIILFNEGEKLSATYSLVVKKIIIPITDITLNIENSHLYKNETIQLEATVVPENASNKTLIWTSDSPDVASVNSKGLVTANSVGSSLITVTSERGYLRKSCMIYVKQKATSFYFAPSKGYVYKGEEEQICTFFLPISSEKRELEWSSLNEIIATVDNSGKVHALKDGETTIIAKAKDYPFSAEYHLTVHSKPIPVTGINIDFDDASMKVGDEYSFEATVIPADANNKTIFWSSSNKGLVYINDQKIIAKKAGVTTITANTIDGSFSDSFELTISPNIIKIEDVAFKDNLLALGIDLDKDGEISEAEANEVEDLNLTNKEIRDLSGLEFFTNLERFKCENCLFSSLELPSFKKLYEIYLNNIINLKHLDLSNTTDLLSLRIENGDIKSIDIANCKNLDVLSIENSHLDALCVSENTKLTYIKLINNNLKELDVSSCVGLRSLDCTGNPIVTPIIVFNKSIADKYFAEGFVYVEN